MAVNVTESVIAYFQEQFSELWQYRVTNSEDPRWAAIDFYLKDEDGFSGSFVFSLEILDDFVWLYHCSEIITTTCRIVNGEAETYTYMCDPEFPDNVVSEMKKILQNGEHRDDPVRGAAAPI